MHFIGELNTGSGEINSHAGYTDNSRLEENFRSQRLYSNKVLLGGTGNAWYPRVKRLAEDDYIMFYQDGRWGPNVYYVKSTDCVNWGEPRLLYAAEPTPNKLDTRCFATCDAILLSNGDLLASACFYAKDGYYLNMREKGLVVSVSHDMGETWSEKKVVYYGRTWEPSFLELPSGEIQLYLTHSAPKYAIHGKALTEVSSGVAVIRSFDGGETWTPNVQFSPYAATRIAQQPMYTLDNGITILTDQMPVAILLNNSDTIALFAESKNASGSGHSVSLIRSHDFFATELEIDEYGPADRTDNMYTGIGPYIRQFPSGEVVLSSSNGKTTLRLTNEKADVIYDTVYKPFYSYEASAYTMWSGIEVLDSHTLRVVNCAGIREGSEKVLETNGILSSDMILNHRITAYKAGITPDGDTKDWEKNTEALFVGSVSQAQVALRAATGDSRVSFLIERGDYYLSEKDGFELFIATGDGGVLDIDTDLKGVTSVRYISSTGAAQEYAPSTVQCGVKLFGTVENDGDRDEGAVIELSVLRSMLRNATELGVFVRLKNTDGAKTYPDDVFDGVSYTNHSQWLRIALSDDAAPETTTATPETTTAAPETTTAAPETTTAAPVTTTAAPETTTAAPETTTAAPVTTTAAPETTTAAPETTVSVDSTSADSGDRTARALLIAACAAIIAVVAVVFRKKARGR